MQVCSDPTPMPCSTVVGKLHSLLHSAGLQKRLTVAFCHCIHIWDYLLIIQCAAIQHQCTATLGRANCIPHYPVLLCKTGSQLVWVTAITIMENCSSYRCAVSQEKCTAALGRANCIPHGSMLLCKTGSQLACVTAITPTEICSSYRCAVTYHQCTATLPWAKCTPLCSVLLFQRRLTAALSHGKCTYEDLLIMQVCSHPTPKHCSTALGKMLFPLCSAALQNSLTAALWGKWGFEYLSQESGYRLGSCSWPIYPCCACLFWFPGPFCSFFASPTGCEED